MSLLSSKIIILFIDGSSHPAMSRTAHSDDKCLCITSDARLLYTYLTSTGTTCMLGHRMLYGSEADCWTVNRGEHDTVRQQQRTLLQHDGQHRRSARHRQSRLLLMAVYATRKIPNVADDVVRVVDPKWELIRIQRQVISLGLPSSSILCCKPKTTPAYPLERVYPTGRRSMYTGCESWAVGRNSDKMSEGPQQKEISTTWLRSERHGDQ
ncbi:hypothetical protein Y032_0005g2428 [Ancylostoma ceylanicum]|uniref:Uncharacterized protein n=1 Tax=Ancylostoma ceylanicum TaxID=53326 RepID=A0A016VSS7_9BILA|nr:hypothetical protein Y032_0005g2428 [Ancylostoma ceylanicum]